MASGEPGIEAAQRARMKYSSSSDVADLIEAVRLGRKALAALSGTGALEGAAANDLAASLGMLFERTSDRRYLDEHLERLDYALKVLPSGDINLPAVYTNLAAGRMQRARLTGNQADVTAAVEAARQSVAGGQPGNPDDAIRYGNLAGALRVLHDLTDDRSVIDESIAAGRIAAGAVEPSGYGESMILATLAGSLQQRGIWTSSLSDVGESIMFARRAVASGPASSPWHRTASSVLATALRAKAQLTGDLASLSEAVVLHRENADLVPKEQAEHGLHLVSLATTLLARYEWQEDWADLIAADEAVGRALESPGQLVAAEAWYLRAVLWRYRAGKIAAEGNRSGAVSSADQAVEAARKSLDLVKSAREHPNYLLAKCSALATRYELTGTEAHRAETIAAHRQAIESLAVNTEQAQLAMLNLGIVFLPNDEALAPDVAEAMSLFRRVLAVTEPGEPRWGHASTLIIRAQTLLREVAPEAFDPRELEEMYRQATWARALPPGRRAAAGGAAGVVLMRAGDAPAAAWILADVVRQLPVVAWRGARRQNRESALQPFTEAASHAAACQLTAGGGTPESAAKAVEVLEQGRAVLWAGMLELRRGDAEIAQTQPELADRLRDLAMVLDTPDGGLGDSRAVDQRMVAAAAWDTTVAEIREKAPGFLRSPRLAELLPAAGHGPVVVVNMSEFRCDALIVTRAGVNCVPLPSLTSADIRRNTVRYLEAYERLAQELEAADKPDPEQVLSEVLEWLWDTTAAPVLDALGMGNAPALGEPCPRIWWCPTGLLSLLPLHAAGHHASPSGRDTVLDRVVSSYTPTLGALADASRADVDDGSLLFVGVPKSPGMPPLPGANTDRDLLTKRLGLDFDVLFADDATVAAVSSALPAHRWVHFSCHGKQDLAAPSMGGLKLRDGTLTVTDLSAQGHQGEFAFLAACQTATGGAALPNEAISLATAIHYAGYRNVVGTLWSASDFAVAELTRMFYEYLVRSGGLSPMRSAKALHSAVHRLRDEERKRPSWWTPFIHIGP